MSPQFLGCPQDKGIRKRWVLTVASKSKDDEQDVKKLRPTDRDMPRANWLLGGLHAQDF